MGQVIKRELSIKSDQRAILGSEEFLETLARDNPEIESAMANLERVMGEVVDLARPVAGALEELEGAEGVEAVVPLIPPL